MSNPGVVDQRNFIPLNMMKSSIVSHLSERGSNKQKISTINDDQENERFFAQFHCSVTNNNLT